MKKYALIATTTVLAACAPNTTTSLPPVESSSLSSVLMDKNEGCMTAPSKQFGKYIGDWDIQDWSLSRDDGKTWVEGKGARWNFTCVGDGIAIQDFWMPNGGGAGTNLRIYNPETESWDIVWTARALKGTTKINAKESENGDIVMSYVSPEQTPPRRIIFHPPTKAGWDWSMQMDMSGDKNWTTVYKIKATPR